jgi:2-phospho-L-lactate guanylyltransferase
MTATILMPVKSQEKAKARMTPVFTPAERAGLAWSMFIDVSRALSAVGYPVAVVTNSAPAAAKAADLGWRVFWESEQVSESVSVDAASRQLAVQGVTAVLRLPADVPLVEPRDIQQLAASTLSGRSTMLVPSRDGTGTNAILRSPPDLFPSRFGKNSLLLHKHEALRAGAHLVVIENSRLGLDLDDFDDMKYFMRTPSQTETYCFLSRISLAERIAHAAAGASFD